MINCGFIDNICHDYNRGDIITPKKEIDQMVKPLNWEDQAKIIKWHNKALQDGVGSIAHFKLCCIASDIIANNWDAYCRHSLSPSVRDAWKWGRTHHRTERAINKRLGGN